jgi:nicotinamide mononucleotide transporter
MLSIIVEIIGVASALIYTWLEFEQRSAMWIVGILSSLMYMAITFWSGLYAYMGLYGYYVSVSIYGFYQWKFGGSNKTKHTLLVTHIRWRYAAALLPIGVGLSVVLAYVLRTYVADASMPRVEAIGTTLSIIATWMLTKKFIEHWLVWIVADSIMAVLFFVEGRYPSAGLGVFYAMAAVYGYFKWRREINRQ